MMGKIWSNKTNKNGRIFASYLRVFRVPVRVCMMFQIKLFISSCRVVDKHGEEEICLGQRNKNRSSLTLPLFLCFVFLLLFFFFAVEVFHLSFLLFLQKLLSAHFSFRNIRRKIYVQFPTKHTGNILYLSMKRCLMAGKWEKLVFGPGKLNDHLPSQSVNSW